MTDFLPLFPLKLIVFPGEQVNLHIFEPRYRQLIREVEQNKTTFGIPAFIDNKVMEVGTEISLLEIKRKHPNGNIDVCTEGIGRFKIKEFYKVAPGKLYAGADIDRLPTEHKSNFDINEEILKNLVVLFDILNIQKDVPVNTPDFNCFHVAHQSGFSIEQEYEFLCLETEAQRQEYLLLHLKRLIPVVREMERLKMRSQMNGHFKNVIPPEL